VIETIARAKRDALKAREAALQAGSPPEKERWLALAAIWDQLVFDCTQFVQRHGPIKLQDEKAATKASRR